MSARARHFRVVNFLLFKLSDPETKLWQASSGA
jgi:hypothetical protein